MDMPIGVSINFAGKNEQVEAMLDEGGDRFRDLIDGSLLASMLRSIEGDRIYANQAFVDLFGYASVEEVLAFEEIADIAAPHERKRLKRYRMARMRGEDSPSNYEFDAQRKDGSIIPVQVFVRSLKWDGQDIVHSTFVGLTERRKAEKALRESEARYRTVTEASPDAMLVTDADGIIVFTDSAAVELFAAEPRDQLIGLDMLELIHPKDRESVESRRRRVLRGWSPPFAERTRLRLDGSEFISESHGVPVPWDGKPAILIVVHDITERKKAEKALRESEARYRRLLESTNVIPWEADAKTWMFTYVGPQAEKLMGYPCKQWLEKDFWVDHLHPEDRIWVADYCAKSSDETENYEFEYRMIESGGQSVWLHDIVNVVKENGEPVTLQGFMIDITERKRAEETLQNLSARLISAHEDERSKIARELHDDFSQSLAILTVDLELFRDGLSNSQKKFVDFLTTQIQRAKDLSSRLQLLSRQLHPSFIEHIGLVSAISGFCNELSDRHDLKIELAHEGIPRSLSGDVSLCVFRVVQEALRNIVKHSGARTARIELNGTTADLAVRITDTGIGFDPASDRIKRGLGLVSMRERLRAVGGNFSLKRLEPNGTQLEFRVPLPAPDAISGGQSH